MRLQPGIVLCLLAGCATQPTCVDPKPATELRARAIPLPPPSSWRLGVEFLPPAHRQTDTTTVTDSRQDQPEDPRRRQPPATRTPKRPPEADPAQTELAAALTLVFVEELFDADRRRSERELGFPVLTERIVDPQSPGLPLTSEETAADEEAEWLAEHGTDFLRRPFRRMLRRTPWIEALDGELDEFRADHVPLSEPYRETHAADRHLGRLSLRIHVGDPQDPVELVYIKSGVRIGSSQDRLKIGVTRRLADDLTFAMHARCSYDTGDWSIRSDLGWHLSDQTSLHLVVGDNLDFLATSTVYSLFDSPMDGSPGLLLYAVHLF